MPVALSLDGFKLFFYANEGSPREPTHVHVRNDGAEAKFWLFPQGVRSPAWPKTIVNSWKGPGMNMSPKSMTCDENNLWVELNDGRTLGVPPGVVSPPACRDPGTARSL